ncbi:MAG: Ig-like domain-containing protein [Rubripirellula sp.]
MLSNSGGNRQIIGALVNDGEIALEGERRLTIDGDNAKLDHRGGRISNTVPDATGTIDLTDAELVWSGGTITEDFLLVGSSIDISASVDQQIEIKAHGATSLINNLASGVTIHVEATGTYGSAVMTADPGAVNAGTIRMSSNHGHHHATLDSGNGLVNEGSIEFERNATTTGYFLGSLRNAGSIIIGESGQGNFEGNYIGDGGSISGYFVAHDSTVTLPSSSSAPSRLRLYGTNHLASDVPAGMTLEVGGTGTYGNGILVLDQAVSNHGEIEIVSHHGHYSSSINAGPFLLTNAADGRIDVLRASGNGRYLDGSLRTHGLISVEGGQSFSVRGDAAELDFRGGLLDGAGTMVVEAGPFVWSGGDIDADLAVLDATIDVGAVTDRAVIRSWRDTTLIANRGANATIHVEGTGTYGASVLTAATGAVNDGTIRLASSHGHYSVSVDSADGLLNQGTIQVDRVATTTGYLTGTLRNAGSIIVGAGAAGDFVGDYIGEGGSIAGTLFVRDSTISFPASPPVESRLRAYGTNHLASDVPQGIVLEVAGTGSYGSAELILDQGVMNHGEVQIVSHHGHFSSSVTGGEHRLTNAASGRIDVLRGAGNFRYLNGAVENHGLISVEGGQSFSIRGETAELDFRGGRFVGDGTMVVEGGPLNWSGGDIDADLAIFDGTIDVAAVTDTAVIRQWRNSTLLRNLAADATVYVEATGTYGSAVLTAATDAVNQGTIRLASSHGHYSVSLDGGDGLLNEGTIAVDRAQTTTGYFSGTLRNAGQIIVGSGAVGDFSGNYIGEGGAIDGHFFAHDSIIDLPDSPPSESRLLAYGTNHLASDVPSSMVLEVAATGTFGHANLILGQSITNHGKIDVVSHHGHYASSVSSGDHVLTNAADGVIDVIRSQGNGRNIVGSLTNHGRLFVAWPLTIGGEDADVINTGIIGASSTVTVNADNFINSIGAIIGGGPINITSTTETNDGTIDSGSPAIVDATIDSRIIELVFNAPLSETDLQTLGNYQLILPGPDELLGTTDDIDATNQLTSVAVDDDKQTAWVLLDSSVSSSNARLIVNAASIATDSATPLFSESIVIDRPIEILPSKLDFNLSAGQDTGVSDTDGLTNLPDPTFTYRVNKPGSIELDFTGDGETNFAQVISIPGTYSVQSPVLGDAQHVIQATFFDGQSTPVSQSLSIEIDTGRPTLQSGNSIESAPIYQRAFSFSEPMDADGLTTENITLVGPSGPVTIDNVAVTATGYRLDTDVMIDPGQYDLTFSASLSDLAGNMIEPTVGDAVVDRFELLPDTRPPQLADLRPAGIRTSEVDTIEVRFDEEMSVSTFTSDDLQITLPGGSLADTSAFTVTPISTRLFSVSATGLGASGFYELTVGPNIDDLSGNAMQRAGKGSFTIDRVGPRVTDVSATGNIDEPLTALELTTSEPVNLASLRSALSITNTAGSVSNVSVSYLGGNRYRVSFPPLRTLGEHAINVGPTVTDLSGNPSDQDGNGINGETTDAYASVFTVRLADLIHNNPVALSSSEIALGDSVSVTWDAINAGTLPTTGDWTDRIYLSTDNSLSAEDLLLSDVVASDTVLAVDGTYVQTVDVTVPIERTLLPGSYHILVHLNDSGDLAEANAGLNISSAAIELQLPPLADLTPRNVHVSEGSFAPGETITIDWSTVNDGEAIATAPWIERVYLSPSIAGNDAWLIEEVSVSDSLDFASSVSRSIDVTLPADGLTGQLFVFVEVDAADEVFETNDFNQRTFADESITIESALTAAISRNQVREDDDPVRITLTRNGDVGEALEISVTPDPDSQFTLPSEITMPAGLATITVLATPISGDGVDGDAMVDIGFASDGFASAHVSITVADIDQAALSFADVAAMEEGTTTTFTLTRNDDEQSEQTVRLVAEPANQVSVPKSITFAAGQSTVSIDVTLVEDPVLEQAGSFQLVASAPGYQGTTMDVQTLASDVPDVTVRMPISLGEGQRLKYISVERTVATNMPLTLQFRTDSPNQVSFPRYATIPAADQSISFPIQVIDDDLIEDETTVTIFVDAIDPRTGGVVQQVVASGTTTLSDNDQASLSVILDRTLVAEGATIQGLVRRNEASDEPLVVQLSSSATDEATVPESVTIAAGMRTAAFEITGESDAAVDGEQTAVIYASAVGWGNGSGEVTVSDSDLPDLVAVLSELPETAKTQQRITVSWELRNQGVAPASAGRQRLMLRSESSGQEILIGEYSLNETLDAGHAIRRDVPVDLPQDVGDYRFIVRVDVLDQTREIIETNNVTEAEARLSVQAAYSATVSTDIEVTQAGSPVTLTGTATDSVTGEPAVLESVHVHVQLGSTRRLVTGLTDADGNYTVTFMPLVGEAGVYSVGASHPGTSEFEIQDTFTLVGLRLGASRITVQEAGEATGTVLVRNLADVAVDGLQVEVLDHPDNISVVATLDATSVAGGETTGAQLQITAQDATYVSGFVHVRITSDNAPAIETHVPVSIVPLRSRLTLDMQQLSSTMCVGHQSVWKINVTNNGSKTAEDLSVVLPAGAPWMTLASGLPNELAVGETASFELLLSPPEDLDLTVYNGSIGIEAFDSWTSLSFDLRAVSQMTGDLRVRVANEYHYFADDKPLLEGATVRVLDAFSGQPIADQPVMTTSTDGTITFSELLEGYYELEVSADSHETFRETIRVQPGITNDKLVFISRQAVTYNWTVEEIEIEDRYLIDIEALFETNVPMPVVHTDAKFDLAPLQQVGQEMQVLVRVTNDGLIAVNDVALNFGDHPYYSFEALVDSIDVLPAKTELTIPVIVRRVAAADSGAEGEQAGVPCGLSISLTYSFVCDEKVEKGIPLPVFNFGGECEIPPAPPRSYQPSRGTVGNSGGSARSSIAPVTFTPVESCDCIPFGWNLEVGVSGPLASIVNEAAGYITKVIPIIDDVSIEGKGKVEFEYCCEDDAKRGWGVSAEAQVNLGMTWEYGLGAGAKIELVENKPIKFSDAVFDVELEGQIGLEAIVSAGINGTYEAPCDSEFETWCVGANVQADLFFGVDVEVEVDIEFPGQPEIEVIGVLRGGFQTGAEVFVKYCNTGLKYDACWKGLALIGQVTFPYDGDEVSIGVEYVLIEPDEDCGERNTGEGESFDKDVEIMPVADLATGLNYGSVAEMNAAIGTDFSDDDVLLESNFEEALDRQYAHELPSGQGICSQVSLSLSQELVLTRQGFDAQLQMDNGSSVPLQNFGVDVTVYDQDGHDVTDLFVFRTAEFSGFTGVDGSGELAPGAMGTSNWVLIPLSEAAPDLITEYFVGGQITYTDTGREITIDLEPVSIKVRPQPELDLIYFHQRDVFADDPFTDEIEESEPYSLGVLIKNSGGGAATNLRIESAQPRIIENEKGLLIDFEIIGTEVNGGPVEPTLTANFGDIPAHSSAVAMWRLVSSLQGLFVDYKATFRHLDPSGDQRLSFIKSVEIHEMVRPVRASSFGNPDDGLPDFLVNDNADPHDLPDTLYLSDGSVLPVELALEPAISGTPSSDNRFRATVYATMPDQWGYLRVDDPSDGKYPLVAIRRADGSELPAENFWSTNRTFVGGGRRPLVEDKIHILDHDGAGTYTLIYSNGDIVGPSVTEFVQVDPNPTTVAIDSVTVRFDEPVDFASLDRGDFGLIKNGATIDLPIDLVIEAISESEIRVSGFGTQTGDDAVYQFTVNADSIRDDFGNAGYGAELMTWVKGEAAPAIKSLNQNEDGAFDAVALTMTEAVVSSQISSGFSLTRDGMDVELPELEVFQFAEGGYRVNGFAAIHNGDGEYTLTFDAGQVVDFEGNGGIGSKTLTWNVDTAGPVLQDVASPVTNRRNIAVQRIDVRFDENVDLETFTVDDISLFYAAESTNLLAGESRVTIADQGDGDYRIYGINWPQARSGEYRFVVDATGIRDASGNNGSGQIQATWTVDLERPAQPIDLVWHSDSGSTIAGTTVDQSVRLVGTLPESNLRLAIHDLSTAERLQTITTTTTDLSWSLDLPHDGVNSLELRLIDTAGNVTRFELPEINWNQKPAVLLTEDSEMGLIGGNVSSPLLTFNEAIDPSTFDPEMLQVWKDGRPISVDGVTLVREGSEGEEGSAGTVQYRLAGLDDSLIDNADFRLSIDLGKLRTTDGRGAVGSADFQWQVDVDAPTLSGAERSTVAGEQWSFSFSEAVNMDAYIADRFADLVFPLRSLGTDARDGAGSLAGLTSEAYRYVRDNLSNDTLVIDTSSLPDGVYRWEPTVALIADAAGNELRDVAPILFHRLFADVDANGIIDGDDAIAIRDMIGTQPGDADWDERADLDGDGAITSSDASIASSRRGRRLLLPGDEITQYQNPFYIYDANGDDNVSALDALAIINQLARGPEAIVQEGKYYDVSGDDRISALDALRVINALGRLAFSAEAEAEAIDAVIVHDDPITSDLYDLCFDPGTDWSGSDDDDWSQDEFEILAHDRTARLF